LFIAYEALRIPLADEAGSSPDVYIGKEAVMGVGESLNGYVNVYLKSFAPGSDESMLIPKLVEQAISAIPDNIYHNRWHYCFD